MSSTNVDNVDSWAGHGHQIAVPLSLASAALPEYLRISQMPSTIGHKVHLSDMTRNINSHNNNSTTATPLPEREASVQKIIYVFENSKNISLVKLSI